MKYFYWLLLFSGFSFIKTNGPFNVNAYHVQLGKKVIFRSSENPLGSTISLRTKNITPSEFLKVSGFICGSIGAELVVHLKLTNEHDAILIDSKQSSKAHSHDATVTWKDITSSKYFKDSKVIQVYYGVSETKDKPAAMLLICRVELK